MFRIVVSLLALILCVLLYAALGHADVLDLEAGQQVPSAGVWLDDAGVVRMTNDLLRGKKTTAELETVRAQLIEARARGDAATAEVVNLKDQVVVLERQVALAAKLDAIRLQVDDVTTKALALAASSLELQAKLNDASGRVVDMSAKALEMSNEANKIANAEIARLNQHGFWESLKVVLFGAAAFVAGKGF